MLTVNGEKMWVPNNRKELVTGLKRMGIEHIDDIPLYRVKKAELVKAYCRTRAQQLRQRRSGRREGRKPAADTTRTFDRQHFVAWTAPD